MSLGKSLLVLLIITCSKVHVVVNSATTPSAGATLPYGSLCGPDSIRYTHTHPFNGPLSGTTGWASTRKEKPIWILLKQETVSGSGIRWTMCKSAPRCCQITTPVHHHSIFYRPDAFPGAQPTVSKHWRHNVVYDMRLKMVECPSVVSSVSSHSNAQLVCWVQVAEIHLLTLQATNFVRSNILVINYNAYFTVLVCLIINISLVNVATCLRYSGTFNY